MSTVIALLLLAALLYVILSQLHTTLLAVGLPRWAVLLVDALIVLAFATVPFNGSLTQVFAAHSRP